MFIKLLKILSTIVAILILSSHASSQNTQISSFSKSKKLLLKVYKDNPVTLYCGCSYKGKKPNLSSCGYIPKKNKKRANRIEWEHIVPAWEFGHQLQCWQNGGRKNCRKVSAKFRKMEADINNLAPAIGEINADRSNYRFGMLAQNATQYGRCEVKVNFKQR